MNLLQRIKLHLYLFFLSLLICSLANSEVRDVAELQAVLESRVNSHRSVGLVVGLIDGKDTVITSVGLSDKQNQLAVDESSIFEIGSITKTFTGILLADMVIKGEVELDDPVEKFLPKGTVMPTWKGHDITLLSLATHRSSLPRLPTNLLQHTKDMANPYAAYSVDHLYEFLSSYKLKRDINEKSEYSNLGMGLLGHVLALKAGQSYEALVRERILVPLKMMDTSITVSTDSLPLFANGHDIEGNKTAYWDLPTLAGAGALRSNIGDMMIYLAANMGVTDSPLAQAIELSQKIRYELGSNNIGLAWLTRHGPEGTITWHNGGTGGFRSYIGFDKQKSRGVVVLANSQDNADEIGVAVLANQISSLIPEEFEPILVAQNELKKLTGVYELAPNFKITISHVGDSLYAQATGQSKFELFAKSKNEYFFKVVNASITFNLNAESDVDSLVLHQNGRHKARKIE